MGRVKQYERMPPKVDFSKLVILKIRVCGGEPGPAQALGSKLGPLGLQAKKVNEDIIKMGKEWKGIRVPIHLHCQNRESKVFIKPTASSMVIKDAGNYQRDRKKQKLQNRTGNVTFQQIKNIAKVQEAEGKSEAKDFMGTVTQVLGSALSVGCTVDGKNAKEVTKMVKSGQLKL